MGIDRSGAWWKGAAAADLDEYLRGYTGREHPADRFVHARCDCGAGRFRVAADDEEGYARRTCVACGAEHPMLDSAEHLDAAVPEDCQCPCGHEEFDVAVAFSHREDRSIKWVTIGLRCAACGVLGVYADWKIDFQPSAHLYDAV